MDASRVLPIKVRWNGGVSRGVRTLTIKCADIVEELALKECEEIDSDDDDVLGFESEDSE